MAAAQASENLPRDPFRGMTHERYEWLDHARGMVVLLYAVSIVLSACEGDVLLGKPPLGPTYLNHGYAYYNGRPAMITMIDVGQMIFIFVLGFVGYLAFTGRLEKHGAKAAWVYATRRFAGLYLLSMVAELVVSPMIGETRSWDLALYNGVLSRLAIGALAAYATTYFIRNADWRMAFAGCLLVVHAFLYASYRFDHYTFTDQMLHLRQFPFGVWNMTGVAIAGSACAQWLRIDPSDLKVGFRERIVPVGMTAIALAYMMEWLQPGEHHDVTTSLALLSIGLSAHMLATTYAFNAFGWGIPFLRPLGRNLLLLFVLTATIVDVYCRWVADNLEPMHPYGSLLLLGIVPLGGIILVGIILEKLNIVVRI